MRSRPRAPIASLPPYGKRWNRSSMRQRRPRPADLEDEKRAPVAPPASASTDSVVGCPVVFDQTQRTETVDEEADSAAGRARRLAAAA